VIDGPVVVEQGLHGDRPFRASPFVNFPHRLVDIARRGDDRTLEPSRKWPAEFAHKAVIGADQPDFERHIRQSYDARPDRGDEEMHVRSLHVHVEDAVVGAIVNHTRARPPLAAPHAAIGRAGTRLGLAQRALVGLAGKAVGVAHAAIHTARFDRAAIGRQIIEARSEARVDIFLQHIGARVDVRVGVVDAEAFLHASPPLQLLSLASVPLI